MNDFGTGESNEVILLEIPERIYSKLNMVFDAIYFLIGSPAGHYSPTCGRTSCFAKLGAAINIRRREENPAALQ